MFIELTIIYPFKSSHKKILSLLERHKEKLSTERDCVEFNIYNDTYSDKIIHIIKWTSKDSMKLIIDNKTHKKIIEEMLNFQKFPAEVYRLEENS